MISHESSPEESVSDEIAFDDAPTDTANEGISLPFSSEDAASASDEAMDLSHSGPLLADSDSAEADAQKKKLQQAEEEQVVKNLRKYRKMLEDDLLERELLKLYWVDYKPDKAYYRSWNSFATRSLRKTVLMVKQIKRIRKIV